MDSFEEQLENTKVDYRELPSPREGTEFNAKAQREQFLGGGGKLTEAPTAVNNLASMQTGIDKDPTSMSLLEKANGLLTRPEARTWEEGSWNIRSAHGESKIPLSETFFGLDDKGSNTSFLICNGPEIGGENRYTQIAWAELPDQKGGKVKRSGSVKFIYDKDGKVVDIKGNNGDRSVHEKFGSTLFNDGAWYSGQIGRSSVGIKTLADQERAEILTDIMPKLERATENGINPQFAE
jgi:hypothetical protein